jgi:hypothetical protein
MTTPTYALTVFMLLAIGFVVVLIGCKYKKQKAKKEVE